MFPETCAFEVSISFQDVQRFADISGDHNPLHLDAGYARTTEFGRPIVHGAYLVGLVSRVLGMYIPGKQSLILSIRSRFPKPLFYPVRVRVEGNLHNFDSSRDIGTVRVKVIALASQDIALEAEVNFALHSSAPDISPGKKVEDASLLPSNIEGSNIDAETKPKILVTGGTGGLGGPILGSLERRFSLVCLARKPPVENRTGVNYVFVDLENESALDQLLAQTSPAGFYGILHMSVPPVTRGLISQNLSDAQRHWRHSIEVPILLARWATKSDSSVKRLILFGSIFGTKHPDPQLGAYSLAKAGMEHLVPLLSWDLAVQKATVNLISPGIIPAGLNKGMLERQRKSLAAQTATGRLSEPADLAELIHFVLSESSSQINGATLTVDGGF